ncbi:MAG TPA: hypothetical protein VIX12_03750 [Candidatus Binataceae bacterium]
MRRYLLAAGLVVALSGVVYALDRDRHADYTDPSAAADATAQCKGFYNTDDNLTACQDWCEQYKSQHEGASCKCDDSKCPADEKRN